MGNPMIRRALISVTDKTGVVEFARVLAEEFGVEVVSTGGTARVLAEAGVAVTQVDEVTRFPEMMDGRVKTLHPGVHGGLLAKRENAEHMTQAAAHGIEMIDLVAVNLYAFEDTVSRGASFAECIENIDIGGPSMLRSAAKNAESVTVVIDPADYEAVLDEMRANGGATTPATRRALALRVFEKTAAYDAAIASWMQGVRAAEEGRAGFAAPDTLCLTARKQLDLRYGENPHQAAGFYRLPQAAPHSLACARQLNGKPLSYNNILDTDACWALAREFDEPAVVILKHQNPCGSAVAARVEEAYERAYACDPKSAYGGIIAVNSQVGTGMVERMFANRQFVEVIVAPSFTEGALELLATKPNLRVLATGGVDAPDAWEARSVDGGILVQDVDRVSEDPAGFTVATKRVPTDDEMRDLLFAWRVVKGVKSNAILVAAQRAGVGMGPGQPNRVDSAMLACDRAHEACARMGIPTDALVAASDAFLPFADSVHLLAARGVRAIIQPGGSIRDEECIAACDELGVAMVLTGHRHFKH
ncbi:bifunctional phosphoribosylaminoimidazolecarboxamide formyltransferase/IMP cyclohydrolase [Berryella wangjianweii]|uniref:Bifunctional purine biosynthesis protein PurH n=1 Tax=Berryella wangjianweii TaxID=2734634 RepID=A0A6M8J6X3_9ACTN|nr:bifunctional phosphoribosylaminoimidazolecarboxamide formyltransferase/IMP cyclohydrolase [Berryella wangjianweii]QKF07149.1 bifunctional phosphoribosylaminoimidazolecarboxamide formyltransferase/IMP cyclohydrolase [Berryella wangjianweii]